MSEKDIVNDPHAKGVPSSQARKVIIVKPPTEQEVQADYDKARFYPSGFMLPNYERINRVGIIPYTRHPQTGLLWFAVCIDAKNGDMSDCGGHRLSSHESLSNAATRELYEESIGIFNLRMLLDSDELVYSSPVATNGTTAIFFLKVDTYENPVLYGFPDDLPAMFAKKRQVCIERGVENVYLENSAMYWINESDFSKVLATRTKRTPPARLHASRVAVPKWMQETRKIIQSISAEGTITNGGRRISPKTLEATNRVSHPLLYEMLRRILFPLWGQIVSIL
jgi:hypothetical protein